MSSILLRTPGHAVKLKAQNLCLTDFGGKKKTDEKKRKEKEPLMHIFSTFNNFFPLIFGLGILDFFSPVSP